MKYFILILLILTGNKHLSALGKEEDAMGIIAGFIWLGVDIWAIVWYCNNVL